MKLIFRLTKWQLILLAKYQILSIALGIGLAYAVVLYLFPVLQTDSIIITLIFADPTGMGFIFVGAMVLFEKNDNTLDAQTVTPMNTRHYLYSKALALLIPTIISALPIAIITHGFNFNILPFLISLFLSSTIVTLLGIAGAIRVKTLNQYFMVIPLFLAPAFLPVLNFLGLTHWPWLAIIPTQSSFNLFISAFSNTLTFWNIADTAYLTLWVFISAYVAKQSLEKTIYR